MIISHQPYQKTDSIQIRNRRQGFRHFKPRYRRYKIRRYKTLRIFYHKPAPRTAHFFYFQQNDEIWGFKMPSAPSFLASQILSNPTILLISYYKLLTSFNGSLNSMNQFTKFWAFNPLLSLVFFLFTSGPKNSYLKPQNSRLANTLIGHLFNHTHLLNRLSFTSTPLNFPIISQASLNTSLDSVDTDFKEEHQDFLAYYPSLFSQMRFKWDFFTLPQLQWPYIRRQRRLYLYAYIFKIRQLSTWASTKILGSTPAWRYRRIKSPSLNSYILTDWILPANSIFISSSQIYVDNSFEELRQQAFLLRKTRYVFKKKWRGQPHEMIPITPTFKHQLKPLLPSRTGLLQSKTTKPISSFTLNLAYNFSSLQCIFSLFYDASAFKWLIFQFAPKRALRLFLNDQLDLMSDEFLTTFFYSRRAQNFVSNLRPLPIFSHKIERHFVKIINKIVYKPVMTPWHVMNMHRFFTFCTGKKVTVRVNNFIKNSLTLKEQALCLKWSLKLIKYRKALGNSLFLNESLQIFYLSFKLKDPYFFSNWLTKMFQKVSFWKSRLMLSYVRYVIRNFFYPRFDELKMRGVKFQLSGKISVAGNARTRTIRYKVGYTSQSTFDNKVLTVMNLIPSFTGIQGFKIWFFF